MLAAGRLAESRRRPLGLQELWASAEDIRAEAKKHGYVAAVADGPECLAAVLFRLGTGQVLKLPLRGTFSSRTAAAVVSLGGGCGCCCASVYGISSTAVQKELLSQPMRDTVRSSGHSVAAPA